MGKHRHNLTNHRLYKIYYGMKQRCYNSNVPHFHNYGGRGIAICEEWLDKESGFISFYNWSMDNGYADDLTIDRINNNGNYAPNNCKWATNNEQMHNRRIKNNAGVSGVAWDKTMNKWHAKIKINYNNIHLGYFDNIEEAIKIRKLAEQKYWHGNDEIELNVIRTKTFSKIKSGKKGVHWDKNRNKWVAAIRVNNKYTFIGYYFQLDEAITAREKAEREYLGAN